MAKHIARIVVTVLILGAIAYASWAFFFKPDNNEYVYSELLDLNETVSSYTDSNISELEEQIGALTNANYFGTSSNQIVFATGQQDAIINIRAFLLGMSSAEYANFYGVTPEYFNVMQASNYFVLKNDVTLAIYETSAFIAYENILTDAYNYYTPYTQFATGVMDEEIDMFKEHVNVLNNKHDAILEQIEDILDYQTSITTVNSTVNTVLTGYYEALLNDYVDYYVAYADLVDYLRVFVGERTTENTFIYDIQASYLNSAVESIAYYVSVVDFNADSFASGALTASEVALNKYLTESIMYRENLAIAMDNLSDETYFELVNVYNTLNQNYASILFGDNSIFTYSNANKLLVMQDDSSAIASIRVEQLDNVQILLEKLGFPAPVVEPEPEV